MCWMRSLSAQTRAPSQDAGPQDFNASRGLQGKAARAEAEANAPEERIPQRAARLLARAARDSEQTADKSG